MNEGSDERGLRVLPRKTRQSTLASRSIDSSRFRVARSTRKHNTSELHVGGTHRGRSASRAGRCHFALAAVSYSHLRCRCRLFFCRSAPCGDSLRSVLLGITNVSAFVERRGCVARNYGLGARLNTPPRSRGRSIRSPRGKKQRAPRSRAASNAATASQTSQAAAHI